MSSLRRVNASRANGARSRGPKTAAGKAKSSTNAIQHGLLGQCVVLQNESDRGFQEVVAQHTNRFQPADGVELAWIEEMATAHWRMRRAWAIEGRLMDEALSHQPAGDEAYRIAAAYMELAASQGLDLLYRYETRLHRTYQRALQNVLLLGKYFLPNEPSPKNGHSAEQSSNPPRLLLQLQRTRS
jgi:hypothetical protein